MKYELIEGRMPLGDGAVKIIQIRRISDGFIVFKYPKAKRFESNFKDLLEKINVIGENYGDQEDAESVIEELIEEFKTLIKRVALRS